MPAFTTFRNTEAMNHIAVLQQQVAELQAASARNDALIKELAAQVQQTLTALEQFSSESEARLRRALIAARVSLGVGAVALVLALFALGYSQLR